MNSKDKRLEISFSPNIYSLLLVSPLPQLGRYRRIHIPSLSKGCVIDPTMEDLPLFSDQTQGLFQDKLHWENFIDAYKGYHREPSIELSKSHQTTPFKTKKDVMDRLQSFFNIRRAEGFMLVLTGNSENGELILEMPKESACLTLEEVIDLWKSHARPGIFLFLILDFDQSGSWVKKMPTPPPPGLFIQASCSETQKSVDVPGLGSLFLNNLLHANKYPVKFSDKYLFEGQEIQTPCFCGQKDLVRRIFNFQAGIDSWGRLKEILEVNKGNMIYEGLYICKEKDDLRSAVPHDKGKIKYLNGVVKYEGSFLNGSLHGWGVYTFSSGDKYEGMFENNEMTGFGKLKSKDPSMGNYEGHFKNGVFDGEGTLTFPDGRIIKAIWKDGEYSG